MGFLVHIHHHIDDITYPSGRYTVYIRSYMSCHLIRTFMKQVWEM